MNLRKTWRRNWRKGSAISRAFQGAGLPRLQPVLCPDERGLGLLRAPSEPDSFATLFAWADVERAVAFKRDLVIEDLLCLQFELADASAHEVNEEMAGWDELLTLLPERLPGALSKDSLLAEVTLPAYATEETVVFERHRG